MNLLHLLDDAKCFEVIRAHRWPEGVRCPHCHADQITKHNIRLHGYSLLSPLLSLPLTSAP